jgi:hypothetical protein
MMAWRTTTSPASATSIIGERPLRVRNTNQEHRRWRGNDAHRGGKGFNEKATEAGRDALGY